MKIIQTKTAPNPRRVRIFLAEKGIEVPYEEVDILKKVFDSVLRGAEAVGFDLTSERVWLHNLGRSGRASA